MKEMQKVMFAYIARKKELEEGILPFVEPGSTAESMAFDEWFFIKRQIGTLVYGAKKIVDN